MLTGTETKPVRGEPSPAAPIEHRTLRERVVYRLKRYIADRGLRPGDRLPTEHELAALFGVSRTAVREASKSLEALGYTQARPRQGTVLREPGWELVADALSFSPQAREATLAQVHEARKLLEVSILPLVVERATSEDLAGLDESIRLMREAVRAGGVGIEEDVLFHRRLVAAAHNPVFRTFEQAIAAFFLEVRTIHLSTSIAGRSKACDDHEKIVQAIQERDAARAQQCMTAHLEDYIERGLIARWGNPSAPAPAAGASEEE